MVWRIELTGAPRKQLGKLGHGDAKRILDYLRERIESDPRQLGKPLKARQELWRYRVADYRLICELRDVALVVLVVRIGHRSAVYR